MPTKDELTNMLAVANERIAELEASADEGGDLEEKVAELEERLASSAEDTLLNVTEATIAIVGLDRWNEAVAQAADEAGEGVVADVLEMQGEREVPGVEGAETQIEPYTYERAFLDGLEAQEEYDAILHVLLRPVTTDDGQEGATQNTGRMALLEAEVRRLTVERDDARHKLTLERHKGGAMHGTIDDLKPVV